MMALEQRRAAVQQRRDVTQEYVRGYLLRSGKANIDLPSLDRFLSNYRVLESYRAFMQHDPEMKIPSIFLRTLVAKRVKEGFEQLLYHGSHGPWLRVAIGDAIFPFTMEMMQRTAFQIDRSRNTDYEHLLNSLPEAVVRHVQKMVGPPQPSEYESLTVDRFIAQDGTHASDLMIGFLTTLKDKMKARGYSLATHHAAVARVRTPRFCSPRGPRITWIGEKRSNFLPRDVIRVQLLLTPLLGLNLHIRGICKYQDLEAVIRAHPATTQGIIVSAFPNGFTICDSEGYPLANFCAALSGMKVPWGNLGLVAYPGPTLSSALSRSRFGCQVIYVESRSMYNRNVENGLASSSTSRTSWGHMGVDDMIARTVHAVTCTPAVRSVTLNVRYGEGRYYRASENSAGIRYSQLDTRLSSWVTSVKFIDSLAPHRAIRPYLVIRVSKVVDLRGLCMTCTSLLLSPDLVQQCMRGCEMHPQFDQNHMIRVIKEGTLEYCCSEL